MEINTVDRLYNKEVDVFLTEEMLDFCNMFNRVVTNSSEQLHGSFILNKTPDTINGVWKLAINPVEIVVDNNFGLVTIEDDRYGQTGFKWLAWRCAAEDVPPYDVPDDNEREEFWRTYTGIVGKGNTPNCALVDLQNKVKDFQSTL